MESKRHFCEEDVWWLWRKVFQNKDSVSNNASVFLLINEEDADEYFVELVEQFFAVEKGWA